MTFQGFGFWVIAVPGRMTIVKVDNETDAREQGEAMLDRRDRANGFYVQNVRPATKADMDWFANMGGGPLSEED